MMDEKMVDDKADRWMDGLKWWMDGWMKKLMDGWMDEWKMVDGKSGRMDGWKMVDEKRWMDGWWMDGLKMVDG